MLWTAPAPRDRSAVDWLSQPERFKKVRQATTAAFEVEGIGEDRRGNADKVDPGIGTTTWVNASLNACFRLGPDPRRALWPAASPPRKQAGHMTAPDQCCTNGRKFLPRRRRPHMTHSGHRLGRNPAAQRFPATTSRNVQLCLPDSRLPCMARPDRLSWAYAHHADHRLRVCRLRRRGAGARRVQSLPSDQGRWQATQMLRPPRSILLERAG